MSGDIKAEPYLDPRDLEYAQTLAGDEREAVLTTVSRFRRPDRLGVSDPLPELELLRLDDGARVALGSLVTGRPLVLVFGSFT
jgi:hypothetical protein